MTYYATGGPTGGYSIHDGNNERKSTAIMSANRVDLGSFSSRCCTFRCTHTSADPIRVLCTRLDLPLTISPPSRLAPSARLAVGVPFRALWLAGVFLRRNKICAGVVERRTDWVLKGEGEGMTTPLLLQYVSRFDEAGEIFVFEGGGYNESWPGCSLFVGFPSLFVAPSGEQLALPMCWRGTSLSTISRVFIPILFSGQCVVVDVEGVGFRSKAVVVGRGVVVVCTRISSQEYVYDK